MRIKKTLLWLLMIGIFCMLPPPGFLSAAAAEGGTRVFDEAGLFTDQEAAELESGINAVEEKIKMDLAVLTIDDAMGKSTEEYADDYYNQSGLGRGSDHSGALCMIDMENRQFYILTEGKMARYLTDARIESMLDKASEYTQEGDFAKAVESMVDDVSSYVDAGIVEGQYNYDRDTGKVDAYRRRSLAWYEILLALAGAGAIAVMPCLSTVKRYRMEAEQKQALNYHLAYRGASAFAFNTANDLLLNKTVSQRRIQQNLNVKGPGSGGGRGSLGAGRSTMHRSSGGRSHGGGGRGF